LKTWVAGTSPARGHRQSTAAGEQRQRIVARIVKVDRFLRIGTVDHRVEQPQGARGFFHKLSGWRLTTVCADPAADQPADLVDAARGVLIAR
jgi:hypothetical protein